MCREAVIEAGAELVRFARSVGLVPGEWVAIDGSKFQSVSRVDRVREREALKRYLDQLERADEQHVPPKRTVNDHGGGNYSTAVSSSTTRRATPSVAQQARRSGVRSTLKRIAP
jgi:hypothetical protein